MKDMSNSLPWGSVRLNCPEKRRVSTVTHGSRPRAVVGGQQASAVRTQRSVTPAHAPGAHSSPLRILSPLRTLQARRARGRLRTCVSADVGQERHGVATPAHLPAVLADVALVLLSLPVDLLSVLHYVLVHLPEQLLMLPFNVQE